MTVAPHAAWDMVMRKGGGGKVKKGNIGLAKDIVFYCVLLEQAMHL